MSQARRKFSADVKIWIVLKALRGETCLAELCCMKHSRLKPILFSRRPGLPLDHINVDFRLIPQKASRNMLDKTPLRIGKPRIYSLVRNADGQHIADEADRRDHSRQAAEVWQLLADPFPCGNRRNA